MPKLSTSLSVLIALILCAWAVDRTTAADAAVAAVTGTGGQPVPGSAANATAVIRRSKRYLDFLPLSRMFVGII